MSEFLKHVEENLPTFNVWIDTHARLQASADVLQPLIKPFKEANPTVNVDGCHDCIIDMLIWARAELKKSKEVKPKADKK